MGEQGDERRDRQVERGRMVQAQLARRGIHDARVLRAFETVPRELFVSQAQAEHAYDDAPLPIGHGQTISQPYVVALMVEALHLRGDERVLEVGAGSGYAAAILSRLARQVYAIERIEPLAQAARARLSQLGYDNVQLRCGDGSLGWPEQAPFDAIVVAASGPSPPPALIEQLAIGGRLVIPVGSSESSQSLRCITRRSETDCDETSLGGVRFVPLIGAQAWEKAGD